MSKIKVWFLSLDPEARKFVTAAVLIVFAGVILYAVLMIVIPRPHIRRF